MFPQSHSIIAKGLYESFLKNLNVSLDLKGFIYGCVKPDFSLSLLKMSHYKDKSLEATCSMIKALHDKKLPEANKDIKQFSIYLGVIAHYLADYFCYPHNNKIYNFIPIHFAYENKLAFTLDKIDVGKLSSYFLPSINSISTDNENWMLDYINEKHREYLHRNGRVFNDIFYSIQVCTTVLCTIIKKCQQNSLQNVV